LLSAGYFLSAARGEARLRRIGVAEAASARTVAGNPGGTGFGLLRVRRPRPASSIPPA